jgi:predicted esterase
MLLARRALLIALLLATAYTRADDPIVPGKLNQKVSVKSFSYALYIPKNYDPRQQWPTVFVLDPGARGSRAAEQFILGAEKYGYIIAASNDSRNGPLRFDAINAMWADVTSRFNVDSRRIFVAGMSGGARAAIDVAAVCKDCVAGIIACAAGFPHKIPFDGAKIMFFGIAGLYDFNYPELYNDNEALDRARATHRFESFDGAHGWPPADTLSVALAWFRLQEMARGTTPRDTAFIEEHFNSARASAAKLESDGKLYPAYLAYKQLIADFAPIHETSEAQKHLDALKGRREIASGMKSERNQFAAQDTFQSDVLALMQSLEAGTGDPDIAIRALQLTTDLRERSLHERDPNQLVPLRRALASITIAAFEMGNTPKKRNDFIATRKLYQVALATRPDSPDLLYNIACLYALEGNRKEAIRTLKSSVDHGFKDFELLRTDPDLDKLRADPEFKNLLAKVQPPNHD